MSWESFSRRRTERFGRDAESLVDAGEVHESCKDGAALVGDGAEVAMEEGRVEVLVGGEILEALELDA